jgi:hypothetical protein
MLIRGPNEGKALRRKIGGRDWVPAMIDKRKSMTAEHRFDHVIRKLSWRLFQLVRNPSFELFGEE